MSKKLPPNDVPKIRAFVYSLPGRTVEVFYGTLEFQMRGLTFVVDDAELDTEEKRFALKPVNQGPFVCLPYREVVLLTKDRIIVRGGDKEKETDWAMRIEARDVRDT
ncbi:MAG: hypothetical protein ACYCVB_07345 [Bacilli bacterium]